ncbi:MAG: FtsX-like permease family protein [Desulfobacterales bacterium]|jgi:putative ABC transport system permease protein|nr:FtsX-like permease family protein [Desulfobacterales bacterium]
MTLQWIAIRNLMRRRGKAAFILAGLVIGIGTAVGIVSYVNAVTHDILHKLEQYGANILIVPRTENLALSYGGLSLGGVSFELEELRESELAALASIPNAGNIAALGPMVLGVAAVEGRRILMAGVDFSAAGILKPWWEVRGRIPAQDEVLLGAEAARVLNLGIGDRLPVGGRSLAIAGVLAPTGSQDDHLAFTNLADAQAAFDKPGRISMAEVAALCKDCPIEEMVLQISAALPRAKVMAIQQVVQSRMEMLAQFKKFAYGISAVVLLIGSLVVLVTMMGSVRERTDEIGIFRAIGFRRSHIMRIVFLEAGLLSLLAGVLGYGLGLAAVQVALSASAEGHAVHLPLSPETALGALALALSLGLLASAYPAALAARMDPNDALRSL